LSRREPLAGFAALTAAGGRVTPRQARAHAQPLRVLMPPKPRRDAQPADEQPVEILH
jgi:hypothetical protein